MSVGRISGPLLTANLLRQGVDLAFENDLLYLDVSANKRVGINVAGPSRDFQIDGSFLTTDLLVDTRVTVDDIEINGTSSTITSFLNGLNFVASDRIQTDNVRTDYLDFDNNVISTVVANSSVEIRPNGTGDVNVFSDTKINSNLFVSKDITLDGEVITLGNQPSDVVVIAADVASDINPNITGEYSLGSSTKTWGSLSSNLFNGSAFIIGGLDTDANINLALRPGKSWFVATNGSDTNQGNHENGPFATIAKALSVAQSGDTVLVYPGVYDEVLPLVVPVGVTVTGTELRTCVVVPDTSSTHSDVFLVNGETTISNLTIKNFYYDSIANTGHAFRFALNFKVTSRSPYIQNVTVITRGSIMTSDDPLGFDQGDAGRGAYIDGSVATSDSKQASMLFHSCTFVTPNVDCITMTNGVRVEWLNSFTYFANRGLYATNGSLGFANLANKFGAEIRSIGSANVYGNYGAVADGASTLMYLIMHNFAYIGTGKDSSNDNFLHIEANNAVELNSGKIVYQSTDQKGKFKVGEEFFVDFETGTTSISTSGADITGASSIQVGTEPYVTYIDAFKVDLQNLTLRGNDLLSKTGPINVTAANGVISFSKNVLANKNVTLSGNMSVGGQLTFGNASTDTIVFDAPITESIIPSTTRVYSLGSFSKIWSNTYSKNAFFDGVGIVNNTITTNTLNTDLQLNAAGIGRINIPSNSVLMEKNLTVLAPSTLASVSITDPLMLVIGNITQVGTAQRTGDYRLTGSLVATSGTGPAVQFSDIKIENALVTTTQSNSNLEFRAAGAGTVKIPVNNVQVNNNFTVGGTFNASSISVPQRLTTDKFSTGNILIDDNFIKTTSLNSDLILDANSAGFVNFQKDVQINQGLTVSLGSTSLKVVTLQGTLNQTGLYQHVGNSNRTGNFTTSGSITTSSFAQFSNIRVSGNTIATTLSNSDLDLVANGTGIIRIPLNTVRVGGNVNANLTTTAGNLSVTNRITADEFRTGNIVINDNYITTTIVPNDLRLLANGIGKVTAPSNLVVLDKNLTVSGLTALKATTINGTLSRVGNTTQTGSRTQTGNLDLTGSITVGSDAYFKNIDIVNNSIRTSDSNSDLELRAVGSGIVKIPYDNVYLANKLSIGGVTSTGNITSSATVLANQFTNGNIVIDDNYITTTVGNSNLVLTGAGLGGVKLESLKFNGSEISTESNNDSIVITPGTNSNVIFDSVTALKVPVGTAANRPISSTTIGEIRFNTTDNLFSGWRTFGGVFSQNRLTYARAHPSNNTINFVANSVSTLEVLPDRLRLNGLLINNSVLLNNNTISSNVANSTWYLNPNGTGVPIINEIKISESQFTNLNPTAPLILKSTADGHIKFGGTYGIVIPVGDSSTRATNHVDDGDLRFNTELDYAEIYSKKEQAYIPITGTGEVVTQEIVQELGDLWALILG